VTASKKRWSRRVTETSDALTLEEGVFKRKDPRGIASSLKRSAQRSKRRKADPYRSAMSMLTFYINRAGKNMPRGQKQTLEKAKDELRSLYAKKPRVTATGRKRVRGKKATGRSKRRAGRRTAS
jgi:hypothetical protein